MTNAGIEKVSSQYILLGLFIFLVIVQFPIAGFADKYRAKPFVLAGELMMAVSVIAFGIFFAEGSSPSMSRGSIIVLNTLDVIW